MRTVTNVSRGLNGSYLQGHIQADYSDLIELFGEPAARDDGKVTREWSLLFRDGTKETIPATIYDWKGVSGWSVGGYDGRALECVQTFLRSRPNAPPQP